MDAAYVYGMTTTNQPTVEKVTIEWQNDDCPDLSWLDQFENSQDLEEQKYYQRDQERKASYGDRWEMLGCIAKAVVSYDIGQGSRRLETLTSGGLWGIESDSGKDYFSEVESEQLADLADHLRHFGINTTTEALRDLIS